MLNSMWSVIVSFNKHSFKAWVTRKRKTSSKCSEKSRREKVYGSWETETENCCTKCKKCPKIEKIARLKKKNSVLSASFFSALSILLLVYFRLKNFELWSPYQIYFQNVKCLVKYGEDTSEFRYFSGVLAPNSQSKEHSYDYIVVLIFSPE